MMNRRNTYCFISDGNKRYYSAEIKSDGKYLVTSSMSPVPIKDDPSNLNDIELEFGTNREYFSLVRSVNYPLEFVGDGAAILRKLYYSGRASWQKAYLTIIQWNGVRNVFELSYYGRFDFSNKDDSVIGKFTVPCVDDSAWGILSTRDDVTYSIECNARNPKAVRVLLDNINLVTRFTFQTVGTQITLVKKQGVRWVQLPLVLINTDGDSIGVIVKDQQLDLNFAPGVGGTQNPGFLTIMKSVGDATISGRLSFTVSWEPGSTIFEMNFGLSTRKRFINLNIPILNPRPDVVYTNDFTWSGSVDETDEFMALRMDTLSSSLGTQAYVNLIESNTSVSIKTRADARVVYAIRPLDYVRQIVSMATEGRFTINSKFLSVNNRSVITSGDAIRNIDNAKASSSFKDFFRSFNAIYFMAMRQTSGELWLEKAISIYNNEGELLDVGEGNDFSISPATEYFGNEIEVGSPKQNYQRPSGRLEFNSVNTFSLPGVDNKGKLSFVSNYRLGCYDITFLVMDFLQDSTKDYPGDKDIYLLDISDETGSASADVGNFVNLDFINTPLQPIIKSPFNGDVISNNRPIIKGVASPGETIYIYVDSILDGSTVSGTDGRWEYVLQNELSEYEPDVRSGTHLISATYIDMNSPRSDINITINNSVDNSFYVSYPYNGDYLYNNLPLIKGGGKYGDPVNIYLGGFKVETVYIDESCNWEYKFTEPILNGQHTLLINGVHISFEVNSAVSTPLITYVDGELDGYPIINDLPLIKGVAMPGEVVTVWLSYISYSPLGTTTADSFGNWQLQVSPINYIDPVTGTPVVLAPIKNGLNVISTSLSIKYASVSVTGYLLNRPPYSEIRGVHDNSVFNTEFSPKRMLANHYPMISAIMASMQDKSIEFQTADKNPAFATVMNGVEIAENSNIPVSTIGKPIATLENIKFRTKTGKRFSDLMYSFSSSSIIRASYMGKGFFMLPIGSMKMSNITSEVQEWSLLASPLMSYEYILSLFNKGLLININKNTMYHSDKNSLHLVEYDFKRSEKYNVSDIYEDWFEDRNGQWTGNPRYIQKFGISDSVRDQIITNGIADASLKLYRCSDASLVKSFDYAPILPPPIPPPHIVMEADIDLSELGEGVFFGVLFAGEGMVAITEKIYVKEKWSNTILVEASNEKNSVDFFYSSGIRTVIRVEGLVKKMQPSITKIVSLNGDGSSELLHSQISKMRTIRFGTAYGIPDYLYLKVINSFSCNNLFIENTRYTLDPESEIEVSDDIDGHPMYYYDVNMIIADNLSGKTFDSPDDDTDMSSVVLVVDAQAFGIPGDSLVNIELRNE